MHSPPWHAGHTHLQGASLIFLGEKESTECLLFGMTFFVDDSTHKMFEESFLVAAGE